MSTEWKIQQKSNKNKILLWNTEQGNMNPKFQGHESFKSSVKSFMRLQAQVIKFAGDTTVLNLITHSDETAYSLQGGVRALFGGWVLIWSHHSGTVIKTASQGLFFLRQLKKFGMGSPSDPHQTSTDAPSRVSCPAATQLYHKALPRVVNSTRDYSIPVPEERLEDHQGPQWPQPHLVVVSTTVLEQHLTHILYITAIFIICICVYSAILIHFCRLTSVLITDCIQYFTALLLLFCVYFLLCLFLLSLILILLFTLHCWAFLCLPVSCADGQ